MVGVSAKTTSWSNGSKAKAQSTTSARGSAKRMALMAWLAQMIDFNYQEKMHQFLCTLLARLGQTGCPKPSVGSTASQRHRESRISTRLFLFVYFLVLFATAGWRPSNWQNYRLRPLVQPAPSRAPGKALLRTARRRPTMPSLLCRLSTEGRELGRSWRLLLCVK